MDSGDNLSLIGYTPELVSSIKKLVGSKKKKK